MATLFRVMSGLSLPFFFSWKAFTCGTPPAPGTGSAGPQAARLARLMSLVSNVFLAAFFVLYSIIESRHVLESMNVLDFGCRGGILSEVRPLPPLRPLCTLPPFPPHPHTLRARHTFWIRASPERAQTRSLSTHRWGISASQRATPRRTLAWPPGSAVFPALNG